MPRLFLNMCKPGTSQVSHSKEPSCHTVSVSCRGDGQRLSHLQGHLDCHSRRDSMLLILLPLPWWKELLETDAIHLTYHREVSALWSTSQGNVNNVKRLIEVALAAKVCHCHLQIRKSLNLNPHKQRRYSAFRGVAWMAHISQKQKLKFLLESLEASPAKLPTIRYYRSVVFSICLYFSQQQNSLHCQLYDERWSRFSAKKVVWGLGMTVYTIKNTKYLCSQLN